MKPVFSLFPHNVFSLFKSRILFLSLNHFPNKPWFLHVSSTSLLKTLCEKEKLLASINIFLLFLQCFLPIRRTFPLSSNLKLSLANCLSLEESKKLSLRKKVVWERVKYFVISKSPSIWQSLVLVFDKGLNCRKSKG